MQNQSFWKAAGVSLLILVALTAVAMADPPRYRRGADNFAKRVWRTLSKDELNREARERNMVAYYEGLLNESSRVSAMNSLITGEQRFDADTWTRLSRRHRGDFRYYDLEPGFVNRDSVDPRADIIVNSQGLADREYTKERRPGTWRVALIGDSITRGQGAPMFTNYETLLEDHLNRDRKPGAPEIEIVNFSVGGYRITQLVDASLEWAPEYRPDVYVLVLSRLSVFRRWADHVTTLVQNGVDLKYDHLRQIVSDSGLQTDDPRGTADAKLARFRLPTVEWAITSIRDRATKDGARMLVILLPNGIEPEILTEEFEGVPEILRNAQVPVIDLLDAFDTVEKPMEYIVSLNDLHPNQRGHKVIYEQLYQALTKDPNLLALWTGEGSATQTNASR
jgi:lysophospholipase L1-like esterase